ncbi:MAG: LegC family aminotransferase [Filimonas sp.]|nr:LegC family aminotransferase [Filimonas sp.]
MYSSVVEYIRQLFESADDFIPLHSPIFRGNEKKYLIECIDSSFVSSVGKFVEQLEELVAHYTNSCKAVACVNGTNALHLALTLVGVKSGDEVVMQPLSFIATANAIAYCGAHPLFIDVDKETMGLSPYKLQSWLIENAEKKNNICYNKTTGRVIRACVPMHTFGHPMLIEDLVNVCNEWGIELVEDAAESLGSFYKEKHTGTFGKIGVISFNGNKTITTGGGGMLLFQDEKLAARAKHLSTQAKVPHKWEFVHDDIGYNYRMPNINAALGCAQMECLPEFIKNKRELAFAYRSYFNKIGITFFDEPVNCKSNFWLNVVLLNNRQERDEFLEYTNANGVMTRPIWQLMNRLSMFKDAQCGDLTNSEWFEERVVNIPSSVRIAPIQLN